MGGQLPSESVVGLGRNTHRQLTGDVRCRHWDSFSKLQAHAAAQDEELAHRRRCPATGTTVFEAWHVELPLLGPLPIMP